MSSIIALRNRRPLLALVIYDEYMHCFERNYVGYRWDYSIRRSIPDLMSAHDGRSCGSECTMDLMLLAI